MFKNVLLTAMALSSVGSALPSVRVPQWAYDQTLRQADCKGKLCSPPPTANYSKVLPVLPRIQWQDDGGYCGSLSIQQIALGRGVWLSQAEVRAHTVPGGGHDEEILETNIQTALDNLHLVWDAFQYKTLPTPQADAYRNWIKKHIVNGNGVVWMIMLAGGHYPVYPKLAPYGFYSHVEPVFGIYSNHPLTDAIFYDDDMIVHSTDADPFTYYRRFDSLVAGVTSQNVSECPQGDYLGYPCIYDVWGFGWAITGVKDTHSTAGLPLSLAMDQSSEPDVTRGQRPSRMTGTVTVTGLQVGQSYELWRWDSVESAYDYANASKTVPFIAQNASSRSFVYADPDPIISNTAVYYACHPSA